MTNQEEIREGITARIMKPLDFVDLTETFIPEITIPRLIMEYLHSQGVVLKVKGELPSIFDSNEDVISAYEYKQKMVGYGKFESLVEER